jgi:probable rRNA maturation factor
MIAIDIAKDYRSQISFHKIEEAARIALRHQSAPENAEITIVITGDEQLKNLNLEFLGIDAPTDVLSFPSQFLDPETEAQYLGDIIISYPRASSQAEYGGHAVMLEIQLLVVHGVLHLLGHDHAEPKEKDAMWSSQKEILHELGLGDLKVPEST